MSHVVPKVLCVGVAGAARDPEREALWQASAERDVAEEVVIHPTIRLRWMMHSATGRVCCLISGTGSAAFGRGPSDRRRAVADGVRCAATKEAVPGSGAVR